MATPAYTQTAIGQGCYSHEWDLTTANHTGAILELPGAPDRSVQFAGTWGSATIALEGSNDGTNFVTLTDPAGTDISATEGSPLFAVLANVRYLRPRLTSVGSGAAVTAVLVSRADL